MKKMFAKSKTGLFATTTLRGHLIRGAAAFGLLYLAIDQQHAHPAWSVAAGLGALVALRGCPVCWMIGLVETVQQRVVQWRGARAT